MRYRTRSALAARRGNGIAGRNGQRHAARCRGGLDVNKGFGMKNTIVGFASVMLASLSFGGIKSASDGLELVLG